MKKANIGENITFKRKYNYFTGTVTKVYENSVVVEVSDEDKEKLALPSNQTVVNHKHYEVRKSS